MEELTELLKDIGGVLHDFKMSVVHLHSLIEEEHRRKLVQPVFYNKALINGTNYTLDTRERDRIFIWSPIAFTLNITNPVSVPMAVAAGTWVELGFNSGTSYNTSGLTNLTTITFKCTNSTVV